MITFKPVTNPLIDAIEFVSKRLKGTALEQEALNECEADLVIISAFFTCTPQQAIILALLLQQHFVNIIPSIREAVDHLEIKTSVATQFNDLLKEFVQKQWVKPAQNPILFPTTDYHLDPRMIRCVVFNSWDEMKEPVRVINTDLQFLELFERILSSFTKVRSFKALAVKIKQELSARPGLKLKQFVSGLGLTDVETCIFLHCCFRHYKYGVHLDIQKIESDLKFTDEEAYFFRNSFQNKTSFLFVNDLITVHSDDELFAMDEYRLTEKAIRSFDSETTLVRKEPVLNLLKRLQPEAIASKIMVYDAGAETSIHKLTGMLAEDNFPKITTRLKEQGMKPGVSVLLYGCPGTGKTETVMQLAKTNNRTVLVADISKIRDKWVGNTEKNIKALFDDYRKALTTCSQTPILLFNEADAVLGKRRAVNDRADQMENNLQNILLDEMENFEGIFIATTNLEDNLDTAFDRRFLYKVKFDKPGEKTVYHLWKTKFPELEEYVLSRLTSAALLTGGQIDNIFKKTTVDKLLDADFILSESYLLELLQQEQILQQSKLNERAPIGFIHKAA